MRLTVLGKSPAWPDAGGACSGYLIEEGSHALLVDCGSAVFSKLRERFAYDRLDAVIVSHLHSDHILDLIPFAYGLTLGHGVPDRVPIPLHGPPGSAATLQALAAALSDPGLIGEAFAISEYAPGVEVAVGPLRARPWPVPHFVDCYAIELSGASGRRLLYGADGRAGPELLAAARGVEVLIAEATLVEPEPNLDERERGHMTAAEAGAIAREAGVGRLVITHISDELDLEAAREAATASFGGQVELAVEGLEIEL